MPTTTIFCPACNHKLRVPDELMSRPVQCPKCGTTFTAPPPALPPRTPVAPDDRERFREGQPAPAASVREYDDDDYGPRRRDWDDEEPRLISPAKVTVPAIFLMLMAAGVLIDAGYRFITALFFPKMIEDAMANMQQIMPAFGGANADTARTSSAIIGAIFVPIALVMFAGAVAMLRRKMYGLAIAGSIASMLSLNCCCVPGLAIGLWCILILMQPDVKAGFS